MKQIRMKGNLIVADKVRRAINRLNTSSKLVDRCHFECFDNCREQGFVLKVFAYTLTDQLFIAFSENRNSDDIVVYCYKNVRFPQNLPATDDDWNDKKYFGSDKVDDAARYIIKRAKEWMI